MLLFVFAATKTNAQQFSGNLTQRYIVEGDNLMKIGDFNGAILSYTNAVNSNVGYGEAYVKRAIALKLVGRTAEGRDDLDKASRLGPQFLSMYDSLTTRGMRRDSLANVNNPFEKIDLNSIPEDTTGFLNMAQNSLETGDYKEAAHYSRGYLLKHPNDTLAITYAALAYTHWGVYDTALVYIKKIIAAPNYAVAYNIYGLYYYKQGIYLEAIDKFNKAIQINPSLSIAYFNRALCKKMLGNERTYNDDFETAIEVDQRVANTYYNRSYYEKSQGDFYSSRDDYKYATGLDANLKHLYYQTSPSKKLLTDYENLFNGFTNAISQTPSDPDNYFNRANFLTLFGEYTPAVIDYNKAVSLSPQNADYLFNRGVARIIKRDSSTGCRDLKKCVDLGVDNAQPLIEKFCR